MEDLIGPSFRQELYDDMVSRFQMLASAIQRTQGRTAFDRYMAGMAAGSADKSSYRRGIRQGHFALHVALFDAGCESAR
jgi:hypothetical protein